MKIVLLGPPAAGKGTQAANLSKHFNIPSISTGAIIRNEISNGSTLGIKAKTFIDNGQLVPDDLVIDIVKSRITADDCKNGYILDGFPRTVVQAQAADEMGIQINRVILIEIPDDEVVKRITGRRECIKCGSVYHTTYNPSKVEGICDKCEGKITCREDDTEETVRIRLSVYHSITEPLKAYYNDKDILTKVTGREKVEDTTKDMFEALGEV